MVETKYGEAKEKAKEQVRTAVAVSLASDMWTSINMDAHLAVLAITLATKISSALPSWECNISHRAHTAENLAAEHARLMEEWGITEKVKHLVTDGAATMNACVRQRNIRHTVCIAHI